MRPFVLQTFLLLFLAVSAFAQITGPVGVITGTVRDRNTQELLVGVTVQTINNTDSIARSSGATTDAEGRFKLTLPVGSYNLWATFVGFVPQEKFNLIVSSGNANESSFELVEERKKLSEVMVKANRAVAAVSSITTPNSIHRLTTEEIKTNPGGNFDVSRVIQTLPGVGGSAAGFATISLSGVVRPTRMCFIWTASRFRSSTTFRRRAAQAGHRACSMYHLLKM
jgi:hypothetical protein